MDPLTTSLVCETTAQPKMEWTSFGATKQAHQPRRWTACIAAPRRIWSEVIEAEVSWKREEESYQVAPWLRDIVTSLLLATGIKPQPVHVQSFLTITVR